MQALKALVIFMGILIFAGMGLLVYGLMTRGGGSSGGGGLLGGKSATPAADFGELTVPVPEGCSLAGTELAGARLVLRLDGLPERGCQQVLVVDLASGRLLGRVKAVPGGQ